MSSCGCVCVFYPTGEASLLSELEESQLSGAAEQLERAASERDEAEALQRKPVRSCN